VRGDVLEQQEPVESANGDQAAGGGRRGQRLVVGVPLAQVRDERGDVGLGDGLGVADRPIGQEGRVPAQVAPVRRERVGGGAALDVQVRQPAGDGDGESRRRPRRGLCAQPSTSANGTDAMPCASATGA
jgi:hypothetical protein